MVFIKNDNLQIDKDGYLNYCDYKTCISEFFVDEFDLFHDVNKYMYELYDEIILNRNDERGMCIIGLYKKIHNLSQSFLLVSSRGLVDSAKILLRSIFENFAILKAISLNIENYQQYIKSQTFQLNGVIKYVSTKNHVDKKRKKAFKLYKNAEKKPISYWAKEADLLDDYNSLYRYLSFSVHSSIIEIQNEYHEDEYGQHYFELSPKIDDIRILFLTIITYLLGVIDSVSCYFQILSNDKYNVIKCKLLDQQKKFKL